MSPNATPPATRRVLVTGGASGIGAAIARRFADDGARVAILDRDPAALERFAGADTPCELTLAADVTVAASVDAAFETLEELWGGVDVLFNNAGISRRQPFLEMSLETWNAVIAVNLTGCFLVAQRAARCMVRDGGGVIINIGSVSGIVGMPNYASYNSSKAGVIELTKTMALELAPEVRVNAISPGYVRTPMQEAEYTPKALRECEESIPAGRLGRPAEIAALGVYLASPEAAFVTGQSVVIDGGETAGGLASG